jgi:hypothetical protein
VGSVSQHAVSRRLLAETSATPVFPTYKSTTRVDIVLLASALFLQRFGLPFVGKTILSVDFVCATVIFSYQFASGRLFIQYDRLLWFLALVLASTSSLLFNFDSGRLTSYGLFLVLYFLFTLNRPSTEDQYKSTLLGFQFLMLILSCIAIAQFPAQFVVDGRKLIMFYGIFPNFLLSPPSEGGWNTIGLISVGGSSLIKSNGIFLVEPATMSQMGALAILIEVLEFHRPRYLIVFTLGLLLAYSGTGISILLVSLPLAVLVNRRAQLPVLLISLFAFGLFATGITHLSAFASRVGEFEDTRASGFARFVSPLWMAADYFHTASPPELLLGKGPGYGAIGAKFGAVFYGTSSNTWFKLFLEYGLVGAFVFTIFLGSCFRRTRCPTPLIAGLIYHYLFTQNNLVTSSLLIIMVVLCTLNGPEPRRGRIAETEYPSPSSLVAGSTAG